MAGANDEQVAGGHYRDHGVPIQHWDWILINGGIAAFWYFFGEVTGYLARWRRKNGVEDLRKARHYATKFAEFLREHPGKDHIWSRDFGTTPVAGYHATVSDGKWLGLEGVERAIVRSIFEKPLHPNTWAAAADEIQRLIALEIDPPAGGEPPEEEPGEEPGRGYVDQDDGGLPPDPIEPPTAPEPSPPFPYRPSRGLDT